MKKVLRILYAPVEITGQMFLLSSELKKLGHQASSLDISSKKVYQRRLDINVPISEYPRLIRYSIQAIIQFIVLPKFDIFHFNFGEPLIPDLPGYLLLKAFRKKIVIHFRGSDIRDTNYVSKKVISDSRIDRFSTKRQKRKIKLAKKFADKILVSTPDLIDLVDGNKVEWFPSSIDLGLWKPEKTRLKKKDKRIFIVHAPSKRQVKGTDIINKTIYDLQKEGWDINYRLVENTSYKDLKKIYQQADIVIDQILIGWYGVLSVEAMSLKKPVICYLRKDLVRKYASNIPIYNANKDNLKEKIIELIKDSKLRNSIGEKGRAFVDKHHDLRNNAQKLEKIYFKMYQ